MTVPIFTSPGRSGFGPQLSLSYDSGSGNGPFGFGWSLSLPSITRKTDKGLPRYLDSDDGEESDVFILSGSEDLVPVLGDDGSYERDIGDATYRIRRYRPRIEGLFARIERWTNANDPSDVHWRSISKDNILTVYGGNQWSRIADPKEPGHVFSWLICETRDDKGNGVIYRYEPENGSGVMLDHAHEHNRGKAEDPRTVNRYLKRIYYGNRTTLLDSKGDRPPFLDEAEIEEQIQTRQWMFEVVFDYGEGHCTDLPLDPAQKPEEQHRFVTANLQDPPGDWPARLDPFSSYRAGFEVRTYRLCRRVLMVHHFEPELGTPDYLVRSTEFDYSETPVASFIRQISQSGYVRQENGTYLKRSLPPLDFGYTSATVHDEVREVDPRSLENLPNGLDGSTYQWVDLDGEGISGVLTEQAGAWFYKRNLTPSPRNIVKGEGYERVEPEFAPVELVASQPAFSLSGGAQFMDLAGDGQPDLVQLEGPVRGFYERTDDAQWEPFRSFVTWPNVDTRDPNLRFVDLDGDGHSDILITENEVLTWYPSVAEEGFGPAQRSPTPLDEEEGPRLVFADGTQSVYLADMSGDGLTDLARIRNGEVCYWPNLGYGRFGAKVTMDNAPRFEEPDQFDQKRIRIADIDGSGNTDIIYLGRDGARLYFNQSGNGWSDAQTLEQFPPIDNVTNVTAVDLLGNGTACLVWSSPLPGNRHGRMRYVDLMGGEKPHLLVSVTNNLGAETKVGYAPSTRFYLRDKEAGNPWITRLPFPVHVVERVETYDRISRNRFVTRYDYHHGYFDGEEREFRGFGRVDQWDTEEIQNIETADANSGGINLDAASFVPPILTKTWFHTGAYLGHGRTSRFFAGLLNGNDRGEYYREPSWQDNDEEAAKHLLDDTILPAGLALEEEREACRALKGSMLRQEVYARDGTDNEEHPYTVVEQNFTVRPVQARQGNRHAVFFVHPREAITYHYERNPEDPRVAHAVTLRVDDFGNVERQADISYPRRPAADSLPEQDQTHITLTLNRFANEAKQSDWYRAGLPVESRTYEMVKPPPVKPPSEVVRFRFDSLARLTETLVPVGEHAAAPTDTVPYQEWDWRRRWNPITEPGGIGATKLRLIEHIRTLYRSDELDGPKPLGQTDSRALPYETYKLAFPIVERGEESLESLARHVFIDLNSNSLAPTEAKLGGILSAAGGYVHVLGDLGWWIPSGQLFYTEDASPTDPASTAGDEKNEGILHFFMPRLYVDPFGNRTTVDYQHDLVAASTTDAVGNTVTAEHEYRVLQPSIITDPNGNRTEVRFDTLGLVVGTAVQGKPPPAPVEGDWFSETFETNLTQGQLDDFHEPTKDPHLVSPQLLETATTRIVYDLDRFRRTRDENPDDPTKWEPAYAATLARETHASDPLPPWQDELKIQISFSYSDGFGREIQKKIQAEPGPLVEGGPTIAPRWVGSGWTIFNNKGKPVRQYEPFLSATHGFEFGVAVGVSPVLFYDPAERVIATLHPNHTYEKVVFDPWQQTTYDVNDTCAPRNDQTGDPRTDLDIKGYVREYFESLPADPPWQTWHEQRVENVLEPHEQTAAMRAAAHADTPTTVHLDVLGRPILTESINRVVCAGHDLHDTEDTFRTRIELDIEGNQREVHDERRLPVGYLPIGLHEQRIVMRYACDMLGSRIYQLSMEAGARWTLNDIAGKPIRAWDSRGHCFTTTYDDLRRPLDQSVRGSTADSDPRTLDRDIVFDRIEYGEPPPLEATAAEETLTRDLNLRSRVFRHFDSAGIATNAGLDADGEPIQAYDFKGNLLRTTRQLVSDYKGIPDWQQSPQLEAETFEGSTRYDALNRPIQSVAPHSSVTRPEHPNKFNVIQPLYNDANLLERVDVWLERAVEPPGLLDPDGGADPPSPVGVNNINYDAKGQRLRIDYKNGASTFYAYDPLTFRLKHLLTRRNASKFPDDCPESPPPERPGCGMQNLHYTYDPAGNITHIQDDAKQTIYFRNQRIEPSNDYVYDAMYRLIQATGREHLGLLSNGKRKPPTAPDAFNAFHTRLDHPGDGKAMGTYRERYVYDAVGSFLQMQHRGDDPAHRGWERTYDYLEPSLIEDGNSGPLKMSNRLSQTKINPNSDGSTVSESYQHDLHGNIAQMSHLPGLRWDYKDQLRQTELGGGGAAFYVYDASGQRVRKVREKSVGLTEERIYLGGVEIFRKYGGPISANTATLERETLHVMDDKQRIALVETRTLDSTGSDEAPRQLIRYQLGNHLGSSSLEVDDQAQIISYEEYTPYGSSTYQALLSQPQTPKRYRYTGKERDEESGLYYHVARYFAPWLGRWTGCDKLGLLDGPNLYLFCRDNPATFHDLTGNHTDHPAPAPAVRSPSPAAPPSPARPTAQSNRAAGLAAARQLKAIVEAKGHGVREEVTVKGGKGGSRVDVAPDPKAPQTIGRTLESKRIDLTAYRDAEQKLDIAKLRRAIRKDIAQVQKHQAALREGRAPDTPYRESLVYTLENASAGEAKAFQKVFRETATPSGIKGGVLQLEKGVLTTVSGRPLAGGARPTPGNAFMVFVDGQFVDELLGAATGTNLEARAKHSDVFPLNPEQRAQLRMERAQHAEQQEFEVDVKATALSEGISDEEAEAHVRQARVARRADVEATRKEYGSPVVSAPVYVPPTQSGWERFKAWARSF